VPFGRVFLVKLVLSLGDPPDFLEAENARSFVAAFFGDGAPSRLPLLRRESCPVQAFPNSPGTPPSSCPTVFVMFTQIPSPL